MSIDKIKDFFKKYALDDLSKPDEVLSLNVENLIGVSPIHAKSLSSKGIVTIRDLAGITEMPDIDDMPTKIIEKLNKIASMLLHYTTKSQEKKIILLGLDNAGKTSILSILQKRFSIIKNLLPTRGVSRQTLDLMGTSLICWDFGGQVAYRNMYMSRPDLFLESDLIIFAIDILDTKRYDESIKYLYQIMELIDKFDKAPLIVDLHKFDPDVQESHELLKQRAELIDRIATKALELNYDCTFINTTIFIKETIEQLFSLAIQKMSAGNFMLEHLTQEYLEKIDAKAIALMTDQNLVLSTYAKDPRLENIVMQSGLLLQALVDYYEKSGLKTETEYHLSLQENNICIKAKKLFNYNENELFLWGIFDSSDKEFIDIEEFKQELNPIIKMI